MSEDTAIPVFTAYPSTQWAKVRTAAQGAQQERVEALNEILCRYYRPLLKHLCFRFQVSESAASDLLHTFVERKILCHNLLTSAKPERGRFRTFLLKALNNCVIDDFRSQTGPTRKPSGGFVNSEESRDATEGITADQVESVAREWVIEVIAAAEDKTRAFYESKGRYESWAVFKEGFLDPTKYETARPSDEQLATKHSLKSRRQVSNIIITVKRHFGKVLRQVILQYEETDAEVDNEIRDLLGHIGKK